MAEQRAHPGELEKFVAGARVDPEVFELRPDYRVLLLAVDGIIPTASDADNEQLLRAAETSAREALATQPVDHLPQVAAYADAPLLIEKEQEDGRTLSRVVSLKGGGERTRELARMLSGVEVTREALGAAEALMRSAHRPLKPVTPRSSRTVSRARQSA